MNDSRRRAVTSGEWLAIREKWCPGVRYTGQFEKTVARQTELVLVYGTANL